MQSFGAGGNISPFQIDKGHRSKVSGGGRQLTKGMMARGEAMLRGHSSLCGLSLGPSGRDVGKERRLFSLTKSP